MADPLPDTPSTSPRQPDLQIVSAAKQRLASAQLQEPGHGNQTTAKDLFNAAVLAGIAIDFAFAILLPLLLAIFIAKYFVRTTGHTWLLPVAIIVALLCSSGIIYRQILSLKKKHQL